MEEAVRILAGIVSKLPGSSIRERTRLIEQHVKNSIINPNIRKGPVERWLMEASGWRMDTDVLVGVYDEKLESSWIAPAWLTPPQPKKAEKRGRQWVLPLGDNHVPVKKEFALRYNKKLDNIPEGLATRNLILELTTTLEARILHVLDLNLKKMASTLLPEPEALELQRHQDLQKEQSIQVTDLDTLPDRLRYGKQCMQMADEIKKIQRLYLDRGFTFEEIRARNPNFLVWSRVLPHLWTMKKRRLPILAGGHAAETAE